MKKIPDNLSHTPIVKLENYETVDGKYENNTDAKGFSIGLAQWDVKPDRDQISAKVFRYENQWSPQSEELPLHRALDLASFICSVIHEHRHGKFINVKGLEPQLSKKQDLQSKLKAALNTDDEHIHKSFDNLAAIVLKIVSEEKDNK